VSDAQQPDAMSKRERQKARRQERLAAEAQAARSQKTKKGLVTGLVLALVVGALGFAGFSAFTDRADRNERIAAAQARLGDLGCTEVEEIPPGPSQHLAGNELVANPPDVLYADRPTTSGRHLGDFVQSGFFDKVIDERLLVHNLEHGYVTIFFDEEAPQADVDDIRDFVDGLVGGNTQKIIASRWKAELPNDGNFAFTAWGARQVCQQWDRGIAEAFLDSYHYLEGTAPERTRQPHLGGAGGGADPDETEGDLLFPPLGEPPAATDAEPTDAEPTDAEPTDAEPTDAEPTDAPTE
jgi:hypothetical protein